MSMWFFAVVIENILRPTLFMRNIHRFNRFLSIELNMKP
ncbi:protein of unknown function (plasmid) [Caballeronia sp. S22]